MIEFRGVCKAFGSKRVLDDLNLVIPGGKITFILGKSGEGKSVTLRTMLGLLRPDRGEVWVDGCRIDQLPEMSLRQHRRQFGMLFQHAALFDSLTVAENVEFPLRELSGVSLQERRGRAQQALAEVGLEGRGELYPHHLSTGERKRVGLARAIVARPKILLYDEPTTGMDPIIAEMIDDLIVQVAHSDPQLTSVVISHDLKASLATADEIVMLYQGQVVLHGPAKTFRDADDPVVRQFFSGSVHGPMEFL